MQFIMRKILFYCTASFAGQIFNTAMYQLFCSVWVIFKTKVEEAAAVSV